MVDGFHRPDPAPNGRAPERNASSGARGEGHPKLLAPMLQRRARLGLDLALIGAVVSAIACSPPASPAQEPEQQSLAMYNLARESREAGRLRESLQQVQKALELDEGNANAAYLGAVVHLQFCAADEKSSDCRFDEAEKYARKALDANPELRDAKNALGVILVHERRFDEAVNVLKPLAHDILYNSPESAWGNLGWAYLERGSYDDAIDALRRSIAAQPLFCVGAYRLGLAYEKKNDFVAAREALTKALETPSPDCQKLQDAFDARARVGQKLGLKDDVRSDLTKCVALSGTTPTGQRCVAALKSVQ